MTSVAKNNLLSRIKSVEKAAKLEALIDKDVMQREHNDTANLLRKGLGIVSFNILEDFIKSRTKELFHFLSSSMVRFDRLPIKLQTAATSGALKALIFQSGLEKKNQGDWLSLIHNESKNIFSTSQYPFVLSPLSLLSESSNISPDDIPDVLKCLDITGGWATLKVVSDDIGGGTLDLNSEYKNMFSRRHLCAHDAQFNYQYTWLENSLKDIIAIASAFDVVITTRCKYIERQPGSLFTEHSSKDYFKYRFLVEDSSGYREKSALDSTRTQKIWPDLDTALTGVIPKVRGRDEFLIIINKQRRICDWHI